ncbi:hypothetical protein SAMN05892877_117117 [Rhizobium subbaraonis]|uniref:Uncharacterized protein n=1 Tax=Rhizobium subbaraonis TaxID=908946 RepID=A0A285UWJ7_9HYPH|nr:hypothetical protein [Rhizobium subbaraonis]SOC45728.1 hypothetical protein SAMN05892877_117117 [Rhizobium subbaraonis]
MMDSETVQWGLILFAQVGVMVIGFSLLVTAMSLCRTLSVLASRLNDTQTRLVHLENEEGLRKSETRTVSPPCP